MYINLKDRIKYAHCDNLLATFNNILVTAYSNNLHIYNIETSNFLFNINNKGLIKCIKISNNGKYLMTGSTDGTSNLFNLATGKLVTSFVGHKDWVLCLAISYDNTLFFTGSRLNDETIKLWKIESGTGVCIRTFTGHEQGIFSIEYNEKKRLLISWSWDQKIICWIVDTGQIVFVSTGYNISDRDHKVGVLNLSFSLFALQINSWAEGMHIYIIDTNFKEKNNEYKCVKTLTHVKQVYDFVISPDKKYILTVEDEKINVWDWRNEKIIYEYKLIEVSGIFNISITNTNKIVCYTNNRISKKPEIYILSVYPNLSILLREKGENIYKTNCGKICINNSFKLYNNGELELESTENNYLLTKNSKINIINETLINIDDGKIILKTENLLESSSWVENMKAVIYLETGTGTGTETGTGSGSEYNDNIVLLYRFNIFCNIINMNIYRNLSELIYKYYYEN